MTNFENKSKELYLNLVVKINKEHECWEDKEDEFLGILNELENKNIIDKNTKISYIKKVIERRINNINYYQKTTETLARYYIKLHNLKNLFEENLYKLNNKTDEQKTNFEYLRYLVFLLSLKLNGINAGTVDCTYVNYKNYETEDLKNFKLDKIYLDLIKNL